MEQVGFQSSHRNLPVGEREEWCERRENVQKKPGDEEAKQLIAIAVVLSRMSQ